MDDRFKLKLLSQKLLALGEVNLQSRIETMSRNLEASRVRSIAKTDKGDLKIEGRLGPDGVMKVSIYVVGDQRFL